jgi:acetylornithine deacetylase/succinyl-diaminopimelate desuccinylase-like protein
MTLVEGIAKVFAFRTLPATVLAVLVYLVLFGAVQYGDRVPKVPKNQKGLDLAQAYADLHQIAERPHPMLSHANDIVHTYILDRVRNISSGVEYIEVYDDIVSHASWAAWGGRGAAVYNEATNILVKIQGSDPEYTSGGLSFSSSFKENANPCLPGGGGVLFSAHYDSVSTASGATDDGMGVATLIQLVEYLAKNRPKRTAVFNINNGEEDGLLGAFV